MVIPQDQRSHVFNVTKKALSGVKPNDRVFITTAGSVVLGALTRIEKVKKVGPSELTTQTGRRFKVTTGKGVNEIDAACIACLLTPQLEEVFSALLKLRRKWATFAQETDWAHLPTDVLERVEALVVGGLAENTRLKKFSPRNSDATFRDVISRPQNVSILTWSLKDAEKQADAYKGFTLPPLTVRIELVNGKLRAVNAYEEEFWLRPSSGVTRSKLDKRLALDLFNFASTIKPTRQP